MDDERREGEKKSGTSGALRAVREKTDARLSTESSPYSTAELECSSCTAEL